MKVCNSIEIPSPSNVQIRKLVDDNMLNVPPTVKDEIVSFVQGDLCKLDQLLKIYYVNGEMITSHFINNVLQYKMYNNETKKITQNIFNYPYKINDHFKVMNDTDRTSVGLLWHENIIDMIEHTDKKLSIPFYIKQLNNICVSDYIDRITFQNQIWQFNEMSSLIKTFKNAKMYHNYHFKTTETNPEIRFTKVLTKYSTEYNNLIFIQRLCQTLGMDKSDLFAFFISIKEKLTEQEIAHCLENCEITKLDINRIYKFIDKYINKYTSNNKKEIEIEDVDLDMNDDIDDF